MGWSRDLSVGFGSGRWVFALVGWVDFSVLGWCVVVSRSQFGVEEHAVAAVADAGEPNDA